VGTSAAITVEPASVNHYTFTVGTNQTAGTGFTGTAQGWDTYNNLVTNDSASVITMTNTGSADFYTNGTYGATTTYYTLSSGEAVIFVQDDISETLTLSAEDGPGNVGTSAVITVNPAALAYYTFTVGTSQTAGVGFQGTLQAWDSLDNLMTSDSTTVVTVTDTGSADFYDNPSSPLRRSPSMPSTAAITRAPRPRSGSSRRSSTTTPSR